MTNWMPLSVVVGVKRGLAFFSLILGASLAHAASVAAPTFSPVAGTYTSVQTVTIATTTSGASIRFTTDGSTPSSTAGTLYSGPVSIGATTTLKAIGFKSGSTNSTVTSGTYTINLPVVAAPTFSPVAGTFTSVQTVTIATTTSGASIRYTTDGSTPSSTAGTLYSGPVSIGATTTLKAIGFKSGSTNSSVTSGAYTINLPVVATPTFSPAAGTFTSVQSVTIATTTSGASIRYTTDGSTPSDTVGTLYSGPVSVGATATLKAIGFKAGSTNSSVASGTYTINLPVVAAPTFSPVAGTFTSVQSVTIATTTSGASIRYTTDGSTPSDTVGTVYSGPVSIGVTTTLKAIGFKAGSTNSSVTSGVYTINLPVVAAPTFSPAAGTFNNPQTVTISTATSGASIRYTTDGSTPSSTVGTLYSGPVSIGSTTALKAIAFKAGSTDSSVTSGTHTIVSGAPAFSPVAGTYTSVQSVTITTSTTGATIRYTTDGSTPSGTVGTVYSGPVSIGVTTTLKAIAFKSGITDSSVTSGLYTINLPAAAAPSFSPAAGTFTSVQNVTITSSTSGATIRYTTDGSTPTATVGTVYSTPVNIAVTTTLKAYAFKSGFADSSVTSGTYTINLPVVAAPTFSPAAGTFTSAQNVTITSSTSGATIRYTTDGSTPTATVGTVYSAPVNIAVTTTLKAYAFKSGSTDSSVASATYTINLPPTAAPTFSPAAGTFTSVQTVTISSTTSGATIRYTTDGSAPSSTVGTVYSAPVSIPVTTTLKAIAFKSGSTDSGVTTGTYIINLPPVATPTFSPIAGTYTSVQTVTIASSTSGASFRYTTDGSTPTAAVGTLYAGPVSISATTTLKAIGFKSGASDSAVATGNYIINIPTPPTVPSGLASSSITPTTFTLTWAASTPGTGGAVAGYDVYQNGALIGAAPSTSFNVTGLTAATTYTMTVRSKDVGGNVSAQSSGLPVTTAALPTPPSVPTGLAASNILVTTFTLTWDASTPGTGGSVAGYDIYREGTLVGSSVSPSFNVTGLTASAAYSMTVKAKDSGGNISNASAPLTVIMNATVNQPPVVTIDAPAENALYTLPTTVNLTATANDPDGVVTKVEFFNGPLLLGQSSGPGPSFTYAWAPTAPGFVTLMARATDSGGATANSAVVNFALQPSLPFTADFETREGYVVGSLNRQLGWVVTNGTAQITDTGASRGTQTVVLNTGAIAAQVDQAFGPGVTNPPLVFVDFFVRPVAGVDATAGTLFDVDNARIAFVKNGAFGQFHVLDGNGVGAGVWRVLPALVPIAANNVTPTWQRLTVRLNYPAKTWDFYFNGELIASNLNFRLSGAPYLAWFSLKGSTLASASFDDFYTAPINPLFEDVNNNGIDDVWEASHGLSLAVDSRDGDLDGDGISNLQEYQNKTDPRDFYNGQPPTLLIVGGDGQSGPLGQFNAQPLSVLVKNNAGTIPLVNVPITFEVISGNGLLATTDSGTPMLTQSMTLRTGADGTVRVYYRQPNIVGAASQIRASASTAQVVFNTIAGTSSLPMTGLRLWLATDSITAANGAHVGTWADQSGRGNDATQTNPAIQPLYVTGQLNGRPVLRFSFAGQQFLELGNVMAGATAGEAFVVLKTSAPLNGGALWTWGPGGGAAYSTANNAISDTFGSDQAYSIGPVGSDLTQYHLYNVTTQPNDWQARINGRAIYRNTTNTVAWTTQPRIGGDYAHGYGFYPYTLDGDIAEVLIYDRALSAGEREAVSAYVANKYALYPAPATVAGLTANALNQSQMSLAWTVANRPDQVVYEIERKTGAGSFVKIGETSGGSYFDSGLATSTAYTYRVRMRALSGTGTYSAEVSATTLGAATLALPTTGMRLWLAADAISAVDGARVRTWNDQSGLGNDATQDNSQIQPVYVAGQVNGRPALRFSTAEGRFLRLPNLMAGATAGEAFVILKTAATATGGGLWTWGPNGGSAYLGSNNSIADTFGTTASYSLGQVTPDLKQYHLYNVSTATNDWQVRVNGRALYRSTTNTVDWTTQPLIGADFAHGYGFYTYGFDGDIAEVLVYDHVLSIGEREAVEKYATNKYALYIAPAAVTGLTATAVSATQTNLTWATVDRAESVVYEIERKTGTGAYAKVAETSGTGYFDSGLTVATGYSYRVRMRSASGLGAYSAEASVTTLASGSANFATSGLRLWLRADALGMSGPVGRWVDQSGAGNDAVQSNYASQPRWVANTINGRPVLRFDATQSQSYVLPDLMNVPTVATGGEVFVVVKSSLPSGANNVLWTFNATYQENMFGNLIKMGVRSWYPQGDGTILEYFGSDTGHTITTPAPLGRFNLYNISAQTGAWTARINTSTALFAANNTVAWSDHQPLLGARGYYSIDGNGVPGSAFTGDLAELLIYDRVLSAAERTTVQNYLTQKYALGSGDEVAPTAPTGVTAGAVTTTTIALTWGAASDNVSVTGYDIYVNGQYFGTTTNTAYTVTGLFPNATYTLTVKAKDGAGNASAASVGLAVPTVDTLAPAAPTTLKATNITATTLNLSWLAATDNYGVTGYEIYRNGTLVGQTSGALSYDVTGLTGGTNYSLTVKAIDAAGNRSAASAALAVTTAPTAPGSLSATAITARTLTLTWTAASAGTVAYDIYRDGAWLGSSITLSYAVTGLTPSTSYSFTVKAKDATDQMSAASTPLVVTTAPPDLVPPTVPTNLAASGLAPTSVNLTWTGSTDNVGVVAYNIYRDGVIALRVTGTTALLSGLSPNVTYSITVRAEDAYGNLSGASTALPITTTAATPSTATTGLRLWLAADGITATDGSRVGSWPDQSGRGNNASQGNLTNQPVYVTGQLNGKPVLRFSDAEDRVMTLPDVMAGATAGEAFVVVRTAAPQSSGGLWTWAPQGGSSYSRPDNSINETFGSTTGYSLGIMAADLTQFHLYNVTAATNDWQARINGRSVYRSTVNTVAFNGGPWIGGDYAHGYGFQTYGLDGDIAEILVYDHALTATERETVGVYIASKYALYAAPATVSGLSVAAISGTQTSLGWTAIGRPDQVIYEIERKSGSGAYAKVGEATGNGWTDSSLTPGTTYTYRVRMRALSGTGAYSAEASATTSTSITAAFPTAGMRLWLAADSISAVGTHVGRWEDQSGLGNDATQTNPSIQPLYVAGQLNGRPVLRFSNVGQQFLELGNVMAGATAGEAFVVLKTAAPLSGGGLWTWGPNGGSSYSTSSNAISDTFGTTSSFSFGQVEPDLTQYHLYNVTTQPNDWRARINGREVYRNGTNTVAWTTQPRIGADYAHGYGFYTYALDGDIAEVLIYDHALSAGEREAVGAYVATKYALYPAPGAVTGLTANALNQSQVSLTWTADGRPDQMLYEVERKTGAGAFAKIAETGGASYFDAGLTAGTAYTYRVRMRALSGTGAYSAEASTTTLGAATVELPTTGMRLWLAADAISAVDGARVRTWYDQSGLGNNATQDNRQIQPVYVAGQVNGRPALRFSTAEGRFLRLPNLMAGATAGEAFVILKTAATATGGGLWTWGPNGGSAYLGNNNSIADTFGTTASYSLGQVTPDLKQYHLYNVSTATNDWQVRVNGRALYRSTTNTVDWTTQPLIGADFAHGYGFNTYGFDGDIAEILVYDHVLSMAEREAVEKYATNKYILYGAPVAVTDLVATVVSASQANLTWSTVDRAEDVVYEIERKTGAGAYAKVAETSGTGYFDSGLTAATDYSYRVRMRSVAGLGVYSNEAGVTTLGSGAQTLSLNGLRLWLKADALGMSGPVGRWVDQSGAGNDAVQSNYASQPRWVANTINGRPVLRFDATQSQSYVLPDLMNVPTVATGGEVFVVVKSSLPSGANNVLWTFNATYQENMFGNLIKMGVRSWYPQGDGTILEYFGSDTGHTITTPAPLGRFNLYNISAQTGAWTARINTSTALFAANNTVAWSDYQPLLGARAYYNIDGSEVPGSAFTGDLAELLIYDRVLSAAERTTVQNYLTQKYALGSGDEVAPTAPTGVTAGAVTTTTIALTWGAASDNVSVTGYDIYVNGQYFGTTTNTAYTVTGLFPNTTYTLTVKAKDGAGNASAASVGLAVPTVDTLAPAAPTTLKATNITATTLNLSWLAATDNYGVTGYEIYQNGGLIGQSATANYSVTGLTGGTNYSLTVKAIDAAGNRSAASAALAVTTAPTAPGSLSATAITARTLTLTWTAASAGTVAYDIYRDGAWLGSSITLSYAVTGLTPSTSYSFTVKAKDATDQMSAASTPLVVTTAPPDLVPPTVPTNLAASGLAPTSVNLTWTGSTDNVGVVAYNIYRDGVIALRVTGTTALLSGLSPNVTYSITVRAEDAYGNLSGASTALPITTTAATPSTATTGLRLWLAADGITATDGSRVGSWPDQSGRGNNASQGNLTNQPVYVTGQLNGKPVLRFSDAEDRVMTLPDVMAGATAGEAFVVVRTAAPQSSGGLWTWAPQGGSSYSRPDNSINETFGSTTGYSLGIMAADLTQFHLYNVTAATNDWQARINGRSVYRSTVNTVAFNGGPWIGGDYAHGYGFQTYGLDGDIAEILVYDHALTATEREAVGVYIASKYALYGAPATVSGLSATATSSTQTSLSWTVIGRPDQVIYEIERKSGSGAYAKVGEANGNGWTDSSLTPGTTYTYRVRMRALSGTGAYSAEASATTSTSITAAFPTAGMRLWLAADSISAVGTRVGRWWDQSGLGNDATQANPVNQPVFVAGQLNGRPVLRFTYADARFFELGNIMAGAIAGEVFVVLKAAAPLSGGGLWTWGPNGGSTYSTSNNAISDTFGTTSSFSLGQVEADLTQYHLYNVTTQPNDWRARINGREIYRNTSNTVAWTTQPRIGSDYAHGYGFWPYAFDGDIAEVLVYDHALSAGEREAVGAYVATKYALYPAPGAVMGLTANALNQSQVNLAWVAVNRPDQVVYEIERKTGAGSFAKVAETSGGSYNDSGLIANTAYTYRVRMHALTGTGAYSAEASATTLDPATIGLPATGIRLWLAADSISATDGSRIQLWPDKSALGNNATQFNTSQKPVFVTGQANGRPALRFNTAESRFFGLPDVMNGATAGEAFIVLKASATNGGGVWSWGPNGSVSYTGGSNAIVENFGSTVATDLGQVKPDLKQYHLYNVSSQLNDWQVRINGRMLYRTTANTVAFTNGPLLGGGQGGYFDGDVAEVLVYDHALSAAERTAVEAFLTTKYALYAAPVPVSGLTAAALSATQVNLAWSPLDRPENVSYEIERKVGSGVYVKVGEASGAGYLDGGLTATTAYTYRVRMRNAVGTGLYSNEVTVSTLSSAAADLTLNGLRLWLRADDLSSSGGVDRWPDQSGRGNDAVQFNSANRPQWVAAALNGRPVLRFDAAQEQFLDLPDLMNLPAVAQAGEIYIVLKSSAAAGVENELWNFQSYLSYGSNVPYSLGSRHPSSNGSIVTFFGSDSGRTMSPTSPLNEYHLYNVVAQSSSWEARLNGYLMFSEPQNVLSWSSHAPSLGRRPGWEYQLAGYFTGDIAEAMIYDRALTASERTAVETYLNQKYGLSAVVDTTPPSAPTNVQGQVYSGTSLSLNWPAATDNRGVAGYNIYRDGVLAGTSTGNSFLLTGLTVNTPYNITIRARDAAGNLSGPSPVRTFTPVDNQTPSVPQNLHLESVGPFSFTLAWTASVDDVGAALYDIYYSSTPNGTGSFWQSVTTTSFTTPWWSGTFYFYVRARDAVNHFSPDSSRVQVIVPQFIAYSPDGIVAAGGYNSFAIDPTGATYAWGNNANGQLNESGTTKRFAPIQMNGSKTTIAVGGNHSVSLDSDGAVMAWGQNTNGQVGDGTTTPILRNITVVVPTSIAVAAGSAHSLAADINGTVWAWGLNSDGQLGDGTTVQKLSPVQVSGLTGVMSVAAGASHSLALKGDGTVWAWGLNSNGQLGDGTTTPRLSPVQVPGLTGVTAVYAGQTFSFAVKSDGSVWAWGANADGQLGDGTTTSRLSPVVIPGFTGIRRLAAGSAHAVALKTDGTVWTWGSNSLGQLGDGSTQRSSPARLTNVTSAVGVAAGLVHTLVLRADGVIVALGDNSAGQLGDGTITSLRIKPIQTGAWADTLAIGTGANHTLAVRSDRSLWVWGMNTNSQLGDGTTMDRMLPTKLVGTTLYDKVSGGALHSLALATNGDLWSWGLNTSGQLGDGTNTPRLVPTKVTTLSSMTAIAAGGSHSVALKSDGTVWAWGLNATGQVGDNTSTSPRNSPLQVKIASGNLTGITAVAAGALHSLALKSDGTVWAWGSNASRQLGDGTSSNRLVATPVKINSTTTLTGVIAIAAGSSHSMALKSDGSVWTWGLNSSGQLGDGTTSTRNFATQVSNLSGEQITAIAAGGSHSLALRSTGQVFSWGLNASGQLGDGTLTRRTTPVLVATFFNVVAISCGDNFSIARLADKTLRVWGSNSNGQAGVPVLRQSQAAIALKSSPTDTHQDGLPDAWVIAKFSLAHVPIIIATDDYDEDGLNNLQEFLLGTDPTLPDADQDFLTDVIDAYPDDYFNNTAPTLAIVSGNNQSARVNQFAAQPLKVSVFSSGAPLVNAPVKFKVISGGGKLATTNVGTPTLSLEISAFTDANGIAQIYYQQPMLTGMTSQIQFTAGSAQLVLQSTSTSAVGDSDNDNLPDTWEMAYFGNLNQLGSGDFDGDGFTNLEEYLAGTNPAQSPAATSATLLKLSVWTPLQ